MADVEVVFDDAALDALLNGPDGPIGRDLARRTNAVHRAAVRLVPVDTGRLRSSIAQALGSDGEGLYGIVGTDVEYGPYIEFGTSRMRAQPYLRPALDAARNVP